jgi:hypothetical protein
MFRISRSFFGLCTERPFEWALIILVNLAFATWTDPTNAASNVWYTQIGQWHYRNKDSISGKSFIYHEMQVDGAQLGQATANVRLNFNFQDIRRCEADLILGPVPSSAGLLIQNKQTTYYFITEKGANLNFLRIDRYCNNRLSLLTSGMVEVSDSTRLKLWITSDSLYFGDNLTTIVIEKPPDFHTLNAVGFECPSGSVKVFDMRIEARNGSVKENFDEIMLVNLHLDKMFSNGVKKTK